jgi:FMN phosphatase YigB (HAD superfamily)
MEPMPDRGDDVRSLEDFHRFAVYLFDLDDTLYAEAAYLESAYRGIAREADKDWGIPWRDTLAYLTDSFREEGRAGLFDRLHGRLAAAGATVPERERYVGSCLQILRSHPCRLSLYPHAHEVLKGVRDRGCPALVVTNGNPRQQRNKVAGIDWRGEDAFLEFHYAAETAPKPDPSLFLRIIQPRHGLDRSRYLFVGDSESDHLFARNCGIAFMWAGRLPEICQTAIRRKGGQ